MPFFTTKEAFHARGLTPSTIATAQDESRAPNTDAECFICLEPYAVNASNGNGSSHDPISLPCNHVFGRKCIARWTSEKHTCPMCRAEMYPAAAQTPYARMTGARVAGSGEGGGFSSESGSARAYGFGVHSTDDGERGDEYSGYRRVGGAPVGIRTRLGRYAAVLTDFVPGENGMVGWEQALGEAQVLGESQALGERQALGQTQPLEQHSLGQRAGPRHAQSVEPNRSHQLHPHLGRNRPLVQYQFSAPNISLGPNRQAQPPAPHILPPPNPLLRSPPRPPHDHCMRYTYRPRIRDARPVPPKPYSHSVSASAQTEGQRPLPLPRTSGLDLRMRVATTPRPALSPSLVSPDIRYVIEHARVQAAQTLRENYEDARLGVRVLFDSARAGRPDTAGLYDAGTRHVVGRAGLSARALRGNSEGEDGEGAMR